MPKRKPTKDNKQTSFGFMDKPRRSNAVPSPQKSSLDEEVESTGDEPKPINDIWGYDMNPTTLRTLRSKVTRKGKSHNLSFEDHFNLARRVHYGVHAVESHRYGTFNGEYGVPHEMLSDLTPSENLSLYSSIGELKSAFQRMLDPHTGSDRYVLDFYKALGMSPMAIRNIDQEARLEGLSEIPFVRLVLGLTNEGKKKYNGIGVMARREGRVQNLPHLTERVMRMSQDARREFYLALSQDPKGFRDPFPRRAPSHGEHPEAFYSHGIDIYVGKLIGIFEQLYKLKTAPSQTQA